MTAFVIEYNRITGRSQVTAYPEPGGRREALEHRLRLDSERVSDDVEVVSLVSDSIETVRKTHSRYFAREFVDA
ncbi:MAG: hypothetical protein NVV70_06590 [Cellulomonas sp.]|nr:hypothetical protein [Cellulomonas sp.]MCR6647812.1 hypothetical protein [Cellulomonas sp.]